MISSGWPEALPRPGNLGLERIESISPWFEIRRVDGQTLAILEPNHWEEVISYLILGRERALLFDTGMGIGDIRAEVERLTGLPVIVVNSHSHYDHMGGNHQFSDVRGFDDEFEMSRLKRGYSRAECRKFMGPGSYLDPPPGFDPNSYEIRGTDITKKLRHLETIDLGERMLTVHHTPGETPGGICLQDHRHGLLFTGDFFYPGTLWLHLEEADPQKHRKSRLYLCGLLDRVSFLCPAHNEARAPKEMLARAHEGFDEIAQGRGADLVEKETAYHLFQGFNVGLPAGPRGGQGAG